LTQSGRQEFCELRAEIFLARPLGAWPFASGLAISRAHSVKSLASGLSVRFLSVAVGSIIYKRAKEKNIGHELPTDWFTQKEIP
jgi:hypothetical protein